MRKIFITILILIFCVSSVHAADYTGLTIDQAKRLNQLNKWLNYGINHKRVQDLSLTRALNTSKDTLKVAAEIAVRNDTKQLNKAIYLQVSKSAAKKMIGGVALMGAFALAEMYVDWLISQGDPEQGLHKKDGLIYTEKQSELMTPCGPYVQPSDTYPEVNYVGHYANYNAALAEIQNGGGIIAGPFTAQCRAPDKNLFSYIWAGIGYQDADTGAWIFTTKRWGSYGQPYITYDESPATQLDLEQAAANGFDNDIDTAWNATNDILDDFTGSLHNPDSKNWIGPDGDPTTVVDNPNDYIIPELINSIPLTDLDQMNNDLTDPNVPGITPEGDLDDSSSFYNGPQADQTAALLTGLRNMITEMNSNAESETLTPLPPLDGIGDPSDKGTIAPLVTSFMNGISQLPVISFFTSMKNLTFAGSCDFTLSMPNPITNSVNQVSLSMCPYQSVFEFMGSCLLLIVGVRWTFYLFEG